jgi:hypothetical protein
MDEEAVMSRVMEKQQYWRLAFIVLLVLALSGPWAIFDIISIPAPFDCSEPWVRMDENFCGMLASPFGMIISAIGDSVQPTARTGDSWSDSGLLGVYLPLLIFALPLITSLVLLMSKGAKSWQIIHIIVLFLFSALASLYLYLLLISRAVFWGMWLYVGLLIVMLVFEIIMLTMRRQPAAAREFSGT